LNTSSSWRWIRHFLGACGAFVDGCTFGVASGLIYAAEALLFYVGAVLIARGTYTYLQMVEVLNLVVFTVSIGLQLMALSTFSSSFFITSYSY
jgi:ATP-binding cassette subfamily B (MDR/TAP) protein 1